MGSKDEAARKRTMSSLSVSAEMAGKLAIGYGRDIRAGSKAALQRGLSKREGTVMSSTLCVLVRKSKKEKERGFSR